MRTRLSSALWGIVLIIIGIGIIGKMMGIWEVSLFFNGWWTLFFIVPAFIAMVEHGLRIGNSLALVFGVALFLCCREYLSWELLYRLSVPLVLIVIGMVLVLKNLFHLGNSAQQVPNGKSSIIILFVIFIVGGGLMAGMHFVQKVVGETNYTEYLEEWEETAMRFAKNQNREMISGVITKAELGEISCFKLEGTTGELVIQEGEEYLMEYENIPDDYKIETVDGTLKVYRENSISIFQWELGWNETPKINITVPKGTQLDSVMIENGSGIVKISDITASGVWLTNGSGSVEIHGLTAQETTLKTGSGSLTIKESNLGNAKTETGSGSIKLYETQAVNLSAKSGSGRIQFEGDLTGDCLFSTGSGSIHLALSQRKESYNIQAEFGSGGLYINGKKLQSNTVFNEKAEHSLTFHTGSGRISLSFDE